MLTHAPRFQSLRSAASLVGCVLCLAASQTLAVAPSNPEASEDAVALLAYLNELSSRPFRGVIAGQNLGHGTEVHEKYRDYVVALHERTGKWIGLLGLDYEFIRGYSAKELRKANEVLIAHWEEGGLVTVNATPVNPFHPKGNVFKTEDVDLRVLLESGHLKHRAWMRTLDRWADALAGLRDAGVVVLWRPMQEPNGKHFWYGLKAAANEDGQQYKRLWRHMHHYFTNERGLDNLLWVYSPLGGGSDQCYPGSDVVDVIAGTSYDKNLTIWGYDRAIQYGKPVGMGEWGHHIDHAAGDFEMRRYLERVRDDYPRLAYWVSWHSWGENNQMAIIHNDNAVELMNDPGLITRDEIDWRDGDE